MNTHPQRLVSLWVMFELKIHQLVTAFGNLNRLSELIRVARHTEKGIDTSKGKSYSKEAATVMRDVGKLIDLPVTAAQAERFLRAWETIENRSVEVGEYELRAAQDAVNDLTAAFRSECRARVAFVIAPSTLDLFTQSEPVFGKKVSLKFGKVATDISEGGKCLALERPTACVFHLMRVAEYAVQRLGKRLHVQIDVSTESWYDIIGHVNKAVRALPSQSAAQRRSKQKLAAAAGRLDMVRIATRNDVMHPKATYTIEEAKELFEATRSLMQQLAEIL